MAVSVMLAPVAAVEALDFSVVVVAVNVLELLVLPLGPQPGTRNMKMASAPIAIKPNPDDRLNFESPMI